jgi:hypothetical protein
LAVAWAVAVVKFTRDLINGQNRITPPIAAIVPISDLFPGRVIQGILFIGYGPNGANGGKYSTNGFVYQAGINIVYNQGTAQECKYVADQRQQ